MQFLHQMPDVFKPARKEFGMGKTYFQVFVGPNGPFGDGRTPRLAEFRNGASNTFLVVEGDRSVNWTQPDDISFNQNGVAPRLGGQFVSGFHVGLADGGVRWFDRTALNNLQLRGAIMSDGNGPLLP
jgi:hypothetical protein